MNGGLQNLYQLMNVETRLITAENVYGEKGRGGMAEVTDTPQPEVARIGQPWQKRMAARDLGQKWKTRPCITIPAGTTTTIMDVSGPGIVQHIWITYNIRYHRELVLKIYWDGEDSPSIETPLDDFFCNGWKDRVNIMSQPINVNPTGGFNSFFPMPFRRHARITVTNIGTEDKNGFFYAITLAQTEVPDTAAYFHAQFRRDNPLPYKSDYTLLDGVAGRGHYVGTYMAWQQNSTGWWGEGEIKFFLDGDVEFPTLCGTGTEDYFGGAWGFGANFSAPYLGYPEGACDGRAGNRHGLYRFHIMDPICFRENLKVTMQALGWRSGGRYLPLQDDIASVAYWYQEEPHAAFPALPDRDGLEVI